MAKIGSGMASRKWSGAIWLACARMDARFCPTKSTASTRWVISDSGLPMSGGMSPSRPDSRKPRCIQSRFTVPCATTGTADSSPARLPTRCTWMWSGWP